MEVCEVCGAFLIVGDAQSRVDDHLMGKQHMGYAKIKATVEDLKVSITWDNQREKKNLFLYVNCLHSRWLAKCRCFYIQIPNFSVSLFGIEELTLNSK